MFLLNIRKQIKQSDAIECRINFFMFKKLFLDYGFQQKMMNLFSFEIIYKKGEEMPADFLSRNAVDAISSDLNNFAQEQNKDEILRHIIRRFSCMAVFELLFLYSKYSNSFSSI